jgi:hypothetical protein
LTQPLDAIYGLLRRSECQLKELKLGYQGPFEGRTVQFLEILAMLNCKALTNLHVILSTDYDSRLIEGLALSSSSSFLPALKTLRIENDLERHRVFGVPAIVKMVCSRQSFIESSSSSSIEATNASLRTLQSFRYTAKIWQHQRPTSDVLHPLNELRLAGMDVDFSLGIYDENFAYKDDDNEDEDYVAPSEEELDEPEEEWLDPWCSCDGPEAESDAITELVSDSEGSGNGSTAS